MKAVTIVLALVGLVAAQLGDLPTCATACVLQYTTGDAIAGCNQLAAACICANKNFLDGIACCLVGSCSTEDQAKAVAFAKQICTANNIAVPDQVVCTSGTVTSVAPPKTSTTSAASTSATVGPAATTSSTKNAAPTAGPAAGLLGAAIAAIAML